MQDYTTNINIENKQCFLARSDKEDEDDRVIDEMDF